MLFFRHRLAVLPAMLSICATKLTSSFTIAQNNLRPSLFSRLQAPRQGRCAAMLFFRHRLAVLPAMPAAGDAFEDMLARELAADGDGAAGPSALAAGAAAAVLGNSYVEDLSKLGIGEVSVVASPLM